MQRAAAGRLFWAIVLFSAVSCKPAAATDPRCGSPGLPNQMWLSCSPSGTTITCQARTESNELYCGSVPVGDVTSSARWISTNASIGHFSAPGRFEFALPGTTTLFAEDARLFSNGAFAFTLGPDGHVRPALPFDVVVDDSTTGGILAGATVEFTPAGGDAQRCTSRQGPPFTPCRFWMELPPDFPRSETALVVASKAGYVTARQTVTPRAPFCDQCSPDGVVLRLSRAAP